MAVQPEILPTGAKNWINRHETFKVPIDELFDIKNGNTGNMLDDYNATTQAICGLLKRASDEGKQVRALGAGWSFTDVAASDNWILNTKFLNFIFNLSDQSISANYTGVKQQLLFVQCGNSVLELNLFLKEHNRSIKTSGASNGQTIAGAVSTGTHGAAIDFGSTPDFVKGIHLITDPDKHIWLERKSYPVVSDAFVQKLGAEKIVDDELFNAALVSFGAFGFIHGFVIETEPLYLLEGTREKLTYNDALKLCMQKLDFTNSPLPYGSERPFHFQVVFNPFEKEQTAYVTTMYKRPYKDSYKHPILNKDVAGPGDDAPIFIGKLTDFIPETVPFAVTQLMKLSYPLEKFWGIAAEIFYNTATRGRVLSAAMGVPIEYVTAVIDLLFKLNTKEEPFPGLFAFRYVKATQALLGFTKYEHTCVVELDGVESHLTRGYYDRIWNEMDAQNIPYTFHWGKLHNLTDAKVRKAYGENRDKWVKARNQLLSKEMLKVFNTNSLKNLGLDEII